VVRLVQLVDKECDVARLGDETLLEAPVVIVDARLVLLAAVLQAQDLARLVVEQRATQPVDQRVAIVAAHVAHAAAGGARHRRAVAVRRRVNVDVVAVVLVALVVAQQVARLLDGGRLACARRAHQTELQDLLARRAPRVQVSPVGLLHRVGHDVDRLDLVHDTLIHVLSDFVQRHVANGRPLQCSHTSVVSFIFLDAPCQTRDCSTPYPRQSSLNSTRPCYAPKKRCLPL